MATRSERLNKGVVQSVLENISDKDTTVGNILNAINKPQSSVTALLARALKDDTSNIPTQAEIWSGDKEFMPSQALNIDNPVAGFLVDALADPLNLIGVGSIAKGASTAAKAGKLGKTALKTAEAYDKLSKGGKLAVKLASAGAGIGALAADTPSDIPLSVAKHATGLGLVAPLIGGAQKIGKVGEKALDYIVEGAKPEAFKGANLSYSQAHDIVRGTKGKYDEISRGIVSRDAKLGLYDLSKEEAEQLAKVGDEAFEETIQTRNNLIGDRIKYRLGVEDVDKSIDNLETFQAKRVSGSDFGDRIAVADAGDGTYRKLVANNGSSKFVPVDKAYDSIDDALKGHNRPARVDSFNSHDAIGRGTLDKANKASTVIDQVELNKFNVATNNIVGRNIKKKLEEINNPALTDNVSKFVTRNREMIEDYNAAMKLKHGKDYIDTMPLDFHMFEVKPMESIGDIYNGGTSANLREGLVKRTAEKIQTGGLTLPERMQLESERFALNYMDKTEKQARRIVNGVKFTKLDAKHPLKFVEKTIEGWDSFTNFLKQQQLTFSHSWLVNNATENLTRAYMQNGLTGLLDSAGGLTNRKTMGKLLKLTDPSEAFKRGTQINDTLFQSALNSGAISEGFFGEAFRKGHMSKPMLMARIGSAEASKVFDDVANLGSPAKMYKSYQDLLKKTVGNTGTMIENSARLTTYTDTISKIIAKPDELKRLGINLSPKKVKELVSKGDYYETIKKYPELRALYDKATKVVNDTFFDYGNVTTFEENVMKRLFPYWTFFSNNTKYWADQIANNPDAVKRLAVAYNAVGRAPTSKERKGIPDYLLERGARLSRDGKILSAPNVSFFDFMNTLPTNIGESGLDKAHPILSLAKNLLTKTDDFGNPLLPSDTKSGRKRVYSGGLKLEPFTSSIFRDRRGKKAYTDSDTVAIINELQSALLPVPAIDTAIRTVDSIVNKDEDLEATLRNLVSPVKTKEISKADRLRAIKSRRSKESRLRRNMLESERLKNR